MSRFNSIRPASWLAGFILGAGAAWAVGPPLHVVSQAGRAFNPTEIAIQRGDTVQILNDDGDLLHHVFIDSDQLNFDFGRSEAGQPDQHCFFRCRTLHRAVRHPPQDEAAGPRAIAPAAALCAAANTGAVTRLAGCRRSRHAHNSKRRGTGPARCRSRSAPAPHTGPCLSPEHCRPRARAGPR